nr:reverse transcriptase domain-containing protein [Tanacetum cinerariifolium]
MSAMANTTHLVTTVTKHATNPRDADATPRVNIQEFCEEYYEDILPIIMDKVRHDRRKDVHTSISRSDSSDRRYQRPMSIKHKSMDKDGLTKPWMCEEEDPFTPRTRNFESSRRTRMPHNMKTYDGSRDPEDHDPVEIHNIKQKDGETIEDFMERCKVETGCMKGAPECMRISRFMHGVNNPELTKRLNEHVSKTMEEMMIATTAFIRGETAAASKKKGKEGDLTGSLPLEGHQKRFLQPRRIEELVRAGKLSHLIKEIKHGQDQSKTGKKEATTKDKPTTIYMIQSSLSPYNGIIGRPGIREIQAVPSTPHGMLKFPVEGGIVTIRSTIMIPFECSSVITSSAVSKEERIRPDNFKVALHPDFPDQEVAIRGTLSDKGRTELCSLLKKNLDIFAWQPSDMTGVPSDCYPIPEIDWKVESLCGYPFKCFLDAYKGYHQIQLAEPNEEKTAFHTRQGVYCYTKMPFSLKNAGDTYQRLMDKAFDSQIGRNIEVYVDDLVVKIYTEAKMLRDIEETLRTFRKINMKLNQKVYVWGGRRRVLGICSHPRWDKTVAVLQLPSPRTIKEFQSLNGKLAREHNITYRPRTSVKGLILVDFLIEMPDENPQAPPVAETQQEPWTLFTDGSSSSNNEDEYEALIAGLQIAAQMRVKNVHVSGNQAEQVDSAGGEQDANIQPVVEAAGTAVENVALVQLRRQEKLVEPSLFGACSSSTGETESTIGVFSDLTGSDILVGAIRTVINPDTDLQKVYVPQWSVTNGSCLDNGRICREMVDEFAIPKFFASVRGMEHDQLLTEFNGELLTVKEEEIENLKALLLLREVEAAESIRIRAEASNFEAMEKSLRDETNALRERNTIFEKEQNALDVKVTELETSSAGKEHELTELNALITFFKSRNNSLVDRLEKFHDDQMKVVHDKFDQLYTDFVETTLHLEEKFYPHILTTIFGRRWLLKQGMKLAIIKCMNSHEYLFALGSAIGKAIENEVDYISTLQQLQNVNFPLLVELKSNKDASIETVMDILRLEGPLIHNTIAPISVDDYEVICVDDQAVADEDVASFPNVDEAELNIPQ